MMMGIFPWKIGDLSIENGDLSQQKVICYGIFMMFMDVLMVISGDFGNYIWISWDTLR